MLIYCYLLCLVIFSAYGQSASRNKTFTKAPIYSTRPEKASTAGRLQMLINSSGDADNNCSPLTCCKNEGCNCSQLLPNKILGCSENKKLSVIHCVCATFEEESIAVGQCLYSCNTPTDSDTQYHEIPTNKLCDDFNRNGTLCGECKDG